MSRFRLDGALAGQVAAAREQRGLEMAAMVREALIAYLASPAENLPSAPQCTPAAQGAPTLDACVATLLRALATRDPGAADRGDGVDGALGAGVPPRHLLFLGDAAVAPLPSSPPNAWVRTSSRYDGWAA